MSKAAPHHTDGTLSANVSIAGGETIKVYKLAVSNNSGATVTVPLQYADGSDTYDSVTVPDGQTFVYDIEFLADFGLRLGSVGSTDVTATVYHSSGGA